MSEFSKILTRLGLAYGLMSREDFVEAVSRYAEERNLSEDKVREVIETLFDEMELAKRKKSASAILEVVEMERAAEEKPYAEASEEDLRHMRMMDEIRKLRMSVEALMDYLKSSRHNPNTDQG